MRQAKGWRGWNGWNSSNSSNSWNSWSSWSRFLLLAALPLVAACSDLVTDETLGTRADPAAGPMFRSYVAIGTSIGAGIQSGGINDSTQREAFTYLLARAMGLTPAVNWYYPSLKFPGCPAPFTNPLTGRRVGGATSTACALRTPASAAPVMNNVSIPSLRAAQALNLTDLTFPATDTLKLAQFITGSLNPIDVADRASATFVTLEVGANDVLGAATRGDTSLLTPNASFQSSMTALADRLDLLAASVAVSNVPNVTVIAFFTRASTLFCLKTGACGVPATPPYSSPLFTVDVSCAPSPSGVGNTYLLGFTATATITNVLAAGGAANLNCQTDVATVTTGAGTASAGPTLNPAETAAIAARVAAFNTFISQLATDRGWALANLDSALAANAATIPPVPNFTNPSALFGVNFSLDGVHPNATGHKILANVFRNTIIAKFGVTLAAIP